MQLAKSCITQLCKGGRSGYTRFASIDLMPVHSLVQDQASTRASIIIHKRGRQSQHGDFCWMPVRKSIPDCPGGEGSVCGLSVPKGTTSPPCWKASGSAVLAIIVSIAPPHMPSMPRPRTLKSKEQFDKNAKSKPRKNENEPGVQADLS